MASTNNDSQPSRIHYQTLSSAHLYFVSSHRSSNAASSTGGNLSGLGTGRAVTSDCTGLTHVLLVTSSVRVIHRVHGNTSDLGPLVSLDSVFVESTAGLQDRLVGSATTSDQTNHSSAVAGDGLLRTRWKSNSANALLSILGNNNSIISRSSGHLATVADFRLDVADNSTLRDLTNRQDVSNGKRSYWK